MNIVSRENDPLVSVLLPVYNADKFLAEAIQSVLAQTYQYFELIIIDDGSSDLSWEIGSQFAQIDSRIRLFQHADNQGLVATLNHGLDIAEGKYIARMDADDICLPTRFEKQVEYLQAHPEIGVLGCDIHYMDENGILTLLPDNSFHGDLEIRWNLFFINPFNHPTVMMRKSIIDRHSLRYDPHALHIEDYEYWGRFLKFSKGENLDEVLLHYRLHDESISSFQGLEQARRAVQIGTEIIKLHLPNISASSREIKDWLGITWRIKPLERRSQTRFVLTHLKIWDAFQRKHKNNPGFSALRRDVVAWVAIMFLYPIFPPGWIKALWKLTSIEWRWPIFMVSKLPSINTDKKILTSRMEIIEPGSQH